MYIITDIIHWMS